MFILPIFSKALNTSAVEWLPPNYGYLMLEFCDGISSVEGTGQSEMIPIWDGLPPADKKVIVVCRRFRLLGYRDDKGTWRDERRPDEELGDVIGWHELGF